MTADLVRDSLPDGLHLLDLGSHGLRDLARPEEVFQVTHAELARDFPPLRSLEATPGNLPLQRTEFIGRDQELAQLEKLVDRSRVVTLTGVGGVGKTRLALQAAESLVPRFEDGTWFVDLGPVDDADRVAAAVASAMNLPDRRQGSAEDAIVASARDSHALIVLDNCEHVIEAAARLAEFVTDRCREVVIVATSREPLSVEGEQVLSLGPLPVPVPGDAVTADEILENESVRLFVESASAARAGFSLGDDNASVVASVCRRLDGIPLAIELAAARTQAMSPQTILDRLDERFRLLSQGRRTAMARHQTLRAAVDWSYELLGPTEQLAFIRLSVFAGGFTLEAAETVIDDDGVDRLDVMDALGGLVAKSMVLLDEQATTARYRLLETMREYAAERLALHDAPGRLAERHAAYYVQLSEQAAPHIMGSDDSVWAQRLDAEQDNLHVALTWLRDHDPAGLTRMAKALAQRWRCQRHLREGLGWITAALDRNSEMSPRVRAELAAMGGYIAVNLGLVKRGNDLLRQSLETASAAGDQPRPLALSAMSVGALISNQPREARRYAEEALAQGRARPDAFDSIDCLCTCSSMISMTSDDPRALELADEGIERARSIGNDYLIGLALEAGGIARYRTDPAGAIALLDESIMSSTAISIHTEALLFKGIAHISLREYGPAAQAFDKALAFHHAAGAEYYETMVLGAVAGLLVRVGSKSSAVQLLGSLQRLRDDGRTIGAPRDLAAQEHIRHRLRHTMDAEEFDDLWSAGRRLTLDDAAGLARTELSRVS